MNELFKENIEFVITLGSALVAIIIGVLGIQRYFHKQKIARMKSEQAIKIRELTFEQNQSYQQEIENVRNAAEKELELKESQSKDVSHTLLIQEVKIAYAKYIHITRENQPPVYAKYIDRLGKSIDIYSELQYSRFNKFNKENPNITLTDRGAGVVDQNVLHPWQKLAYTDKPSQKIERMISQDVATSDVCFSSSTYYNGFKEGEEDIGVKMELDTLCARIIADFSSVTFVDELFLKEPDAYKIDTFGDRSKLVGLEKLGKGIYHLVAYDLKKGESLLLDFHVNWDFFDEN